MKIDKFFKNSFIVIFSNTVIGIISFIFSIILSKELGTEGLGLYGLIMPVYFFLLCIVSEGLITAVSTNCASFYSKRDFINLIKTVETIFILIFIWAMIVAVSVFANARTISSIMIRDPRSSDAVRILCPALVFVPLSAVLKGFFYGIGKFNITGIIDIVEKTFRIAALVSIITILSVTGIKGTVSAACAALILGEFISFVILYSFYRIYKGKIVQNPSRPQSKIQLLFNIFTISMPLFINGVLSSSLSTLTALVLPRRLVSTGISYSMALSFIGKFSGMALNIALFPTVVVNSVSTVLVPDLSVSLLRKDYWAVEDRVIQVLRIALLTGMSSLIVGQCIPDTLGKLFYHRADLGSYIQFASLSSVFIFMSSSTFGIMNALGKQKILLRNSLIVSVQELILIYILAGITEIHIYSVGITMMITSLTALLLNYFEIKKICNLRLPGLRFAKIIFTGVLSYILISALNSALPPLTPISKTMIITASGFIFPLVLSRFLHA